MLYEILQYLRNWFVRTVITGDIVIENGQIVTVDGQPRADLFADDQFIRIIGSTMNDGVYQASTAELHDETFTGAVWGLGIPRAVLALVADIESWQTKYGNASTSPYTSESFVNYSRSKLTGANGDSSWQTCFASRLKPWRKI